MRSPPTHHQSGHSRIAGRCDRSDRGSPGSTSNAPKTIQGAQNGNEFNEFKRGLLTDSKDSICSRTDTQVTDSELDSVIRKINYGDDWRTIFKGVAALTINPEADGPGLLLRITRNQGEAVTLVPEGTPGATVVAVRKLNELDYYNLGLRDLSRRLHINETKLLWLIQREKLQESPEFYKLIKVGRSQYKRYSGKCLAALSNLLAQIDLEGLWASRRRAKQRVSTTAATDAALMVI